jgi:cephalosporin hydroxylase
MDIDPTQQFRRECKAHAEAIGNDGDLQALAVAFHRATAPHKYTYNFAWLGRPVIQLPQDTVAVQELIWEVRPDLIIETGIAHGGSLILSASMLALLDLTDAITDSRTLDPKHSSRLVVGIDIDIRSHNRAAIESHPMASRIRMIEGSSVTPSIVRQVHEIASRYKRVLVFLDSNHTHEHVLGELEAYGSLVTVGSYCVVLDTIIEDLGPDAFPDRPWGPGNNPKTAVREYLRNHPEFVIDKSIDNKLLLSVAPDGYLKRV